MKHLVIVALLFVACGAETTVSIAPQPKQQQSPIQTTQSINVPFELTATSYRRFQVACGQAMRARVYLIHGLQSTQDDYLNEPFATWIAGLNSQGVEVITFNLPFASPSYFTNEDYGQGYANGYRDFIAHVVERMNYWYGTPNRAIIGGISWGGLHAFMGIAFHRELFDAYFASVPVTRLTALTEFAGGESNAFDPFQHADTLSLRTGYVQWGDQDFRVNFQLTIDLVNRIQDFNGAPLTTREWDGLGHQSTPENLQAITDWLLNFLPQ